MREKNGTDNNTGNILLIALVVLAAVASIVMLFTDSAVALKIALLAALWAAIIGFFLVYRYRNQAREAANEAEMREEVHSAEMDKLRAEHGNDSTLRELKEEIAVLRDRLEELTGESLGYEPDAIRADARRIPEVESPRRPGDIRVVTDTEPAGKGETGKTRSASSVSQSTGSHVAPPAPAGEEHPPLKYVDSARPEPKKAPETAWEPVTAEQVKVDDEPYHGAHEAPEEKEEAEAPKRPTGAPSADAVAGRIGSHRATKAESNPLSALIHEKTRAEAASDDAERRSEEPSARQRPAVSEQPAPAEEEHAGGRRRRDENAQAVSVAELMRNLKGRGQ
ncbi:hypothetical protein C3B44_10100 [Corynebacterium yudongzhengii]|uniref:DUF6779 domain-containing protein n=1 Tax=Corynebacterium yudongzhengii TaxID=2080740 RepID=A0A2U1T601_9CORY|nr:DUF6779 domain-containing protein [Corynebacterium yudongzhengii]AWB82643.1 hypothetical protein C3B44_10100 [Corynebacterium yudongzhengii]PWC01393.1 hypothetical protein DF222_07660 [Corynebacterium yudongzhengii]